MRGFKKYGTRIKGNKKRQQNSNDDNNLVKFDNYSYAKYWLVFFRKQIK